MCERGDAVCPLLCRMENLFINRFMHMFQSSWSDFADFEKIFVKISNTISGECAFGGSHSAGRLVSDWKVLPHPAPPRLACQAQLPRPSSQSSPLPTLSPSAPATMFSTVVAHFVLLPTVHKGSDFSTSSPVVFCFVFYNSYHDRCEVVLTSLVASVTEHFFIDLVAIYMFSLEKCLFKSFAHFLIGLFLVIEL